MVTSKADIITAINEVPTKKLIDRMAKASETDIGKPIANIDNVDLKTVDENVKLDTINLYDCSDVVYFEPDHGLKTVDRKAKLVSDSDLELDLKNTDGKSEIKDIKSKSEILNKNVNWDDNNTIKMVIKTKKIESELKVTKNEGILLEGGPHLGTGGTHTPLPSPSQYDGYNTITDSSNLPEASEVTFSESSTSSTRFTTRTAHVQPQPQLPERGMDGPEMNLKLSPNLAQADPGLKRQAQQSAEVGGSFAPINRNWPMAKLGSPEDIISSDSKINHCYSENLTRIPELMQSTPANIDLMPEYQSEKSSLFSVKLETKKITGNQRCKSKDGQIT